MGSNKHPIHSMSSYLGSYPPRVPKLLIERLTAPYQVVMDPFCGGGTTLVEASLLGRRSIGIDLNPLAVAITKAKTQSITVEDINDRLTDLATGFSGEGELDDVPDELEPIFHRRTLAQLCYLKRALDDESAEDVFLRGCVLGIMHGKARRDGSTAYLSVDMPNTFSMSPNYVREFVRKHELHAPAVDVFNKLRERSSWLLRAGACPESPGSVVVRGDATDLRRAFPSNGIGEVSAIITSPPYLGILRYGAFNWIRLWFLGYEQYAVDRSLQTTDSLDQYLSFMLSFFVESGRVLSDGAKLALVIGDVSENGQLVPLGERVWQEMSGLVPFELVECQVDGYNAASKTTRVWGENRKGRATPLDRILILERAGGGRESVHHSEIMRADVRS